MNNPGMGPNAGGGAGGPPSGQGMTPQQQMLQQRMQQQQLFRQQQQQMGGVGGPGAGVGVRAGGMGMTRSPMAAGSPQQQQQQFQGGPQQYHQQQPQLMGNSGNTQGNSSGGNFHQQQMMRQQMMMGGNPQQQQQQDFLHHQQQQRQNVVTSLSSPQPSSQQMGQQVPQGPASVPMDVPMESTSAPASVAPPATSGSGSGGVTGAPGPIHSAPGTPLTSSAMNNPATPQTPVSVPDVATRTSSTPTPQPSQQEHQKQQHQGPHPQPPKEFNTATVCKIGQETVQDIVARIHEVFSYLKTLPPPIGSAATDRQTLEKKQRLQEVLRGISQLFKRLHLSWEKVSEATASMETTDLEALIPLRGEPQPLYFGGEPGRDLRTELEKKRGDAYKLALEEHTETAQALAMKNKQLKEIIEQMRNIIWEINTMLAMRQN